MVYVSFSGNATTRSHSNCMDDKVVSLVVEIKKWWDGEKVVSEKAKKAEELSTKADEAMRKAEE